MRFPRLVSAVNRALEGLGAPGRGEAVVCGLSGGPDSVALLDALAALRRRRGFEVVAAHLDHGLRSGSREDAAFCADLCARLEVQLRSGRADVRARARRDRAGTEDAARRERYAFLRSVEQAERAVAIAVAHTRDDQAETLLLRLIRGAGRTGLAGMRPRSGDLIRPLLTVSRAEVLAYLAERGLSWREDPTNGDTALLRNRVRHELLPYLEGRFNPAIREGLARTVALLADEADVLAAAGARLAGAVARMSGETVMLSRPALAALPPAEARLAVRFALAQAGGLEDVSLTHVERLRALARGRSGRRLPLPGGREAVVRFDQIRIGLRRQSPEPFAVSLPVPGEVELPGGLRLRAGTARRPAASNRTMAVVGAPEEPLEVRTRRPGDRVRTRAGEVSLKRFLISRRVPADERSALPLVAAGRRVLWVPGQPVAAARPHERLVRLQLLAAPPSAGRAEGGA